MGEHITAVKEFNKGETIWTSYSYDPLGQIVQVKDDKDNLTMVGYDLMGRRTRIDSPDAGLTEYVFDPASNLVEKITANLRAEGKAIKYDYTYNRLDNIEYPDYTGNNVSYTYGAPGAAFNRADRIVTVTDESGSEKRFYGPLGETIKTIKYVASRTEGKAANSPEIYITQYTYDTYNRLRQLIYPDNELLTYSYNSGGLAESASGTKGDYDYPYLKALTYDKFEQRVFMRQGNGAETGYDYNPRNRRLANLKAAAAGREFMALSYDYDPVGNIMGLDNAAAVRKPYEFGGKSQQRFGYDDLYRLTGSTGQLEQKPNTEYRYTLAMQYDSIHNIVRKDQEDIRITPGGSAITQKKSTYDYSYAYTSSRPHAPTQIGERAFSYDANGNQTGWESDENGTRRTIVWDEENRIQEIKDNGHTMRYAYNDAGERVIKTGPQGETVYVNQFYSVRNREVGSKHVFVGTGRIVTKLVKGQENVTTPGDVTHPGKSDPSGKATGHSGKGNNGGGSGGGSGGKGTILYEPDLFYYHPNHLGSTSFVTDVEGEVYQHLEYFPFGETWIEEVSNQHRVPFLFTAKELEQETGLYYFGARYYDPRTSVWQSPDPILGDYLPSGDKEKDKKLRGMGGVFNSSNLGLYTYVFNNPMQYIDQFGLEPDLNLHIQDSDAYYQAELIDRKSSLYHIASHGTPNNRIVDQTGQVDKFLTGTDLAEKLLDTTDGFADDYRHGQDIILDICYAGGQVAKDAIKKMHSEGHDISIYAATDQVRPYVEKLVRGEPNSSRTRTFTNNMKKWLHLQRADVTVINGGSFREYKYDINKGAFPKSRNVFFLAVALFLQDIRINLWN